MDGSEWPSITDLLSLVDMECDAQLWQIGLQEVSHTCEFESFLQLIHEGHDSNVNIVDLSIMNLPFIIAQNLEVKN